MSNEEALAREIRGLQEMIYQILTQVGEEVVVPIESMQKGVVGNKQISVVQDMARDAFVFSIVEVEDGGVQTSVSEGLEDSDSGTG